MSEHNFVTIGRRSYLLETLDEENRVFVGYRLTKEIITKFLDDKLDNLYGLKTTILFREQGENDIYIHEATLNDLGGLYYIHTPYYNRHRYPSETSYKNAKKYLKIYELQLLGNWFQRFIARHKNMEKTKEIIKEYEEDSKRAQEVDTIYEEAKALKEKWVFRVKEQWFS